MTQHLLNQLGMVAQIVLVGSLTLVVTTALVCVTVGVIIFAVRWFKNPQRY